MDFVWELEWLFSEWLWLSWIIVDKDFITQG